MFSQMNLYIGIVLIGIPMVTSQPDQIMIVRIDSRMFQNLTRGQLPRRCPLWLAVNRIFNRAGLDWCAHEIVPILNVDLDFRFEAVGTAMWSIEPDQVVGVRNQASVLQKLNRL